MMQSSFYTQCVVRDMITHEERVMWVPAEMAIVGNKIYPSDGGQVSIVQKFGNMPAYFVEYNRASQKFMRGECKSFQIKQEECDRRISNV
jgi:hypothetical protein